MQLRCHNGMLASGEQPAEYAEQLLGVARDLRHVALASAVAMAQPTGLERTVRAILTASAGRLPLSLRARRSLYCGCLVIVALAAAARLEAVAVDTPREAGSDTPVLLATRETGVTSASDEVSATDTVSATDELSATSEVSATDELGAAKAQDIALQPAASASPVRMSLSGREAGMRESLLKAYGGTGKTQEVVTEALRWLARNQDRRSGLWSLLGPYEDGAAGPENRDAATAMALIAFQGAGYTPASDRKDPFTSVTQRAWTALLKRQGKDGRFFTEGSSHGRLYTHGMATIAICELYGMTGDLAYREPAQRAVQYCIDTQAAEGGWRYTPGVDSDTSVTGWFVMGLQSAQMAGLDVPSETLTRISDYLDLVSRDGGSQYAYVPSQGKKLSMTAEGLLCRQYLGWKHSDRRLQKGADLLIENLPSWEADQRNVYYWYYASQVCHHMEGKHWRAWNQVMRRLLPEHQVREGRERGSWDPAGDRWGPRGGRLFVTCLSTCMLEVYYRHLPIYQLDLWSR